MAKNPLFTMTFNRLMEEQKLTISKVAKGLFGEIEETRQDRNGNQYRTLVARKRQVVAAWARGRNSPDPEHQMLLADFLKVTRAELMGGEGRRTGLHMGAPDEDGNVLLEVSLAVPEHVARTVHGILEGFQK